MPNQNTHGNRKIIANFILYQIFKMGLLFFGLCTFMNGFGAKKEGEEKEIICISPESN